MDHVNYVHAARQMVLRHQCQRLSADQTRAVVVPAVQQHLAELQIVGGRRDETAATGIKDGRGQIAAFNRIVLQRQGARGERAFIASGKARARTPADIGNAAIMFSRLSLPPTTPTPVLRYAASTMVRFWYPYMRPEVWRSRSTICIGRATGRVTNASSWPETKTPIPAHSGMYISTGSSSATLPFSTSIMNAREVIGLVIE